MAKLRKGCCYSRMERPYTRKSKRREKSYVRGAPYSKIVIFDMGNLQSKFPYAVKLLVREDVQIRHNALEAARISVHKELSKSIGDANFYFKIKKYPHHILREHAMAAGAGADRFQTGMAHSFGKPAGLAAQLRKGEELMAIYTEKKNVDAAKEALRQARCKTPIKGLIEVEERKF
jgi:large subunit ribosomal protein L10e